MDGDSFFGQAGGLFGFPESLLGPVKGAERSISALVVGSWKGARPRIIAIGSDVEVRGNGA
jgi:hypothetical protein